MYHSQFYKYKRRFLTRGLEGLKGPATGPQELSDDYAAGDDVNARDSGDQTGPHPAWGWALATIGGSSWRWG